MTNRIRQIALGAFAVTMLTAGEALASDGLVLIPDWTMLGLLVVLFVLMVFPVNALIFKPIFRVLDERDAKIAGTREKAEKLFAEADEVLSRYEASVREVRAESEQARKQVLETARGEGSSNTTAARGEAEREIAGARQEVARALDVARSGLRAQAEGLARDVAAQALGRPLS